MPSPLPYRIRRKGRANRLPCLLVSPFAHPVIAAHLGERKKRREPASAAKNFSEGRELPRQLPDEPGSRQAPVAHHAARRDLQHLRAFLHAEPAKKTQLDYSGLAR